MCELFHTTRQRKAAPVKFRRIRKSWTTSITFHWGAVQYSCQCVWWISTQERQPCTKSLSHSTVILPSVKTSFCFI